MEPETQPKRWATIQHFYHPTDMSRKSSKLHLIEPCADMEESHRTFLEEFTERGERVHPGIVAEPYNHFSEFVEMLQRASKGEDIPPNYVAHSTYWLVDSSGEIVAISNLRHELNDFLQAYGGHIGYGVRPSVRRRGFATEILRQTLLKAKERGIDRIRVTCSKNNSASAKTIIRNAGTLDDEVYIQQHDDVICRYWIEL